MQKINIMNFDEKNDIIAKALSIPKSDFNKDWNSLMPAILTFLHKNSTAFTMCGHLYNGANYVGEPYYFNILLAPDQTNSVSKDILEKDYNENCEFLAVYEALYEALR